MADSQPHRDPAQARHGAQAWAEQRFFPRDVRASNQPPPRLNLSFPQRRHCITIFPPSPLKESQIRHWRPKAPLTAPIGLGSRKRHPGPLTPRRAQAIFLRSATTRASARALKRLRRSPLEWLPGRLAGLRRPESITAWRRLAFWALRGTLSQRGWACSRSNWISLRKVGRPAASASDTASGKGQSRSIACIH